MSKAWDKENWTSFPGNSRHFCERNPKAKGTRLWKTLYHNWGGRGGGGEAGLARMDNIRRWWYQKKIEQTWKKRKKRPDEGERVILSCPSTKNRRGNQTGNRLGKGLPKEEGPKSFSQSAELNHPQPPIPTSFLPSPSPTHYDTFLKKSHSGPWQPKSLAPRAFIRGKWPAITRRMTNTNFFRRDLECRFALIDTCSDSGCCFGDLPWCKERGFERGFAWYGIIKVSLIFVKGENTK